MGHEKAFSYAAQTGMAWLFAQNGLEFRVQSLRFGVGRPLLLEGVSIREIRGADFGSVLEAGRIEIVPNSWWEIATADKAVVGKILLERVHAYVDLRRKSPPHSQNPELLSLSTPKLLALSLVGSWFSDPSKIQCSGATLDMMSDVSRVSLEGVELSLEKGVTGAFSCELSQLSIGSLTRNFGPFSAQAAWDGRKLTLAEMEVLPGFILQELDLRLPRMRDVAISFRADAFGGILKGDLDLRDAASGRIWDVAVLSSNIGLEGVVAAFDLPVANAKGRVSDARFTFRGEVGRAADAEASFRLLAKDFEWNNQQCQMLEISSSLIQRRLIVSSFTLQQKGNTIKSNGELSIAEGWSKITESPFLINIRAGVGDMDALAMLIGKRALGVKGRLELEGSVSGRPGMLDGFLELHAKDVSYQERRGEHLDVEILFLKNRIEVPKCTLIAGGDLLRAGGSVGISFPYDYSAWVEARIVDITKYTRMSAGFSDRFVSSGSMDMDWKGEGSAEKHGGTFSTSVRDLVSSWTPSGVTGVFKGGYTPEEVRLDSCILEHGNMRLVSKAEVSRGGISLKEVKVALKGQPLIEGQTFLPIDLFMLRHVTHWSKAIRRGRPLELVIKTPGKVDLGELVRLLGQDYPLSGFMVLELDCRGLPECLDGLAHLEVMDFRCGKNSPPPATAVLQGNLKEGALECVGRFMADGMQPVDATLRVAPFFYQQGVPDGRMFNPAASIEGKLVFPKLNLTLIEPFLPSLGHIQGDLAGELRVSESLGNLRFDGEATISEGSFSHGVASSNAMGMAGRIAIADGVVTISELAGRVGEGMFKMYGICQFTKPWEPTYDLNWNFQKAPLDFGTGVKLPMTGYLKAKGGAHEGLLSGKLQIDPIRIGGYPSVRPRLSATRLNLPSWTQSLESIARLAPFGDWNLDILLGADEALKVGASALGWDIVPRLHLGGTGNHPALTGRVELRGLKIESPSGPLFANEATIYLLPDSSHDPFMLVDASGLIAGYPVRAFAWGPLSERKWHIDSASNGFLQDGYWLVRRGMKPITSFDESLPAVDVRLYPNPAGVAQPVSMRVVDDTAWCGGIGFSNSLNFSPGLNALPEQGYSPGFEWAFSP